MDLLTENVYRVVSYALFARHKLTFSLMLCAGIMRHSKVTQREAVIMEEEWNWFLRGSAVAAISDRLESEEDLDVGVQSSSMKGENVSFLCCTFTPDLRVLPLYTHELFNNCFL